MPLTQLTQLLHPTSLGPDPPTSVHPRSSLQNRSAQTQRGFPSIMANVKASERLHRSGSRGATVNLLERFLVWFGFNSVNLIAQTAGDEQKIFAPGRKERGVQSPVSSPAAPRPSLPKPSAGANTHGEPRPPPSPPAARSKPGGPPESQLGGSIQERLKSSNCRFGGRKPRPGATSGLRPLLP